MKRNIKMKIIQKETNNKLKGNQIKEEIMCE